MNLCNDCRNLITIYDYGTVSCEAHMFSVSPKTNCKGYLSNQCTDNKEIYKNNKIIQ